LLFYQGLRIDPATGETIPGQWPAVIDAEQADRIRAGRISKASGYSRRHHASLLSNLDLVVCGYCGSSLRAWQGGRARSDNSRQQYYGCTAKEGRTCPQSRMIQQPLIDERVVTNLLGILGRADELQKHWKARQAQLDPAATLAEMQQQERTLRQKKQRLVAAIAEGIIDFADARTQSTGIDRALAETLARQAELRRDLGSAPDWAALTLTEGDWTALTEPEQREVLALAIEQIQAFATYLLITYRFPLREDHTCTSRIHLPPPQKPGPKPKKQ
jgi:hypothetical protein